jgi:hypothetical protein
MGGWVGSLSCYLATNPFALWPATVRIAEGVHDGVDHGPRLSLVHYVGMLINDEEEIHEITACPKMLCLSS